ncbi:hypothetical protein D1841_14555 [Neglecta sp. X4]|nr:hypothetical protein [Neglectibacter sp. 59]NBJ74442.1 hypothetical protein [Neglectibacter sp. X4]NCE81516.1 hypothetical protein [Neglectibacter sp. X58]
MGTTSFTYSILFLRPVCKRVPGKTKFFLLLSCHLWDGTQIFTDRHGLMKEGIHQDVFHFTVQVRVILFGTGDSNLTAAYTQIDGIVGLVHKGYTCFG